MNRRDFMRTAAVGGAAVAAGINVAEAVVDAPAVDKIIMADERSPRLYVYHRDAVGWRWGNEADQ
jgi:hypothetical protein